MGNQKLYKTIIVDDEPPAIQRLKEILSGFPDVFDVAGDSLSSSESVGLINAVRPDLIFLDIQMPGMNGFEMLQKLDEIPIIVFCTAYDQYSLKAFDTNCVDYLLKPVKRERVEQTAAKLSLFKKESQTEKILNFLKEYSGKPEKKILSSIAVRKGDKIIFIKLDDVAYFEASEKYVSLFNVQGKEHILEQTLKDLEESLPAGFIRVHRAVIINKTYVKELQTYFNSRFSILLNDTGQTRIITGRSYQKQIKEGMGLK
jgi:two-component system, LytTR family, response regulator